MLVFPGGDAGSWKISDFGLSSINRYNREIPTIGDKVQQLNIGTSKTTDRNLEGAHRAPELSSQYKVRFSGRRSDVWSYGCILAEVIAFVLGGDGEVHEFRVYRQHKGSDNFSSDSFYTVSQATFGTPDVSGMTLRDERFEYLLNPKVKEWFDRMRRQYASNLSWLDGYWYLIRDILITKPDARPRMSEVVRRLYKASPVIQTALQPNAVREPLQLSLKPWNLRLPSTERKTETVDWSLSPCGKFACYLTSKKEQGITVFVIQVFKLEGEEPDQNNQVWRTGDLDGDEWSEISMSGPYLAVYGLTRKSDAKVIYHAVLYLPSDKSPDISLECT